MIQLAGYRKYVKKKICWKIGFQGTKTFPAGLMCEYTALVTLNFFFLYILLCKKLLQLIMWFFSVDYSCSGKYWEAEITDLPLFIFFILNPRCSGVVLDFVVDLGVKEQLHHNSLTDGGRSRRQLWWNCPLRCWTRGIKPTLESSWCCNSMRRDGAGPLVCVLTLSSSLSHPHHEQSKKKLRELSII